MSSILDIINITMHIFIEHNFLKLNLIISKNNKLPSETRLK